MKDGLKLITLDVESLPAQNDEMEMNAALVCGKPRGQWWPQIFYLSTQKF